MTRGGENLPVSGSNPHPERTQANDDARSQRSCVAAAPGVLLPFAVYFVLALTFALAIAIGMALAIDLAQFRYAVI